MRRARLLRSPWLAIGLLFVAGCFGPQLQPTPELAQPCQEVPRCARDHVYIFLINGLDPLNCCHFSSLRGYVNALGFNKTYSGQLYHCVTFAHEIRRLKKEDCDARFAVIGFSFGANSARCLCSELRRDGIALDLLIYLGGDTLTKDCSDNARRVVNVTGKGCVFLAGGAIWKGQDLPGADNSRLPDVSHEDIPTHAHTLETVARELMMLAASVPVIIPGAPAGPAAPELGPPPRVMPWTSAKPVTGWDCLKPSPAIDYRH